MRYGVSFGSLRSISLRQEPPPRTVKTDWSAPAGADCERPDESPFVGEQPHKRRAFTANVATVDRLNRSSCDGMRLEGRGAASRASPKYLLPCRLGASIEACSIGTSPEF